MNAAPVRMFVPALRQVERGLALPLSDRVRILRELEYDLEELYERFIREGLDPQEARDRALEALVPDSSTISKLDRLHARWYRRVTTHLTAQHLRLYERGVPLLCTVSVAMIQAVALFRVDLLRDRSPFLFPAVGLGALLFGAVAKRAFDLWTKGDHRLPDPGLQVIVGVSAAILLTGLGGAAFDLFFLASQLEQTPELAEALISAWLLRDSALLSLSMLLALAGGLAWFLLAHWSALVARAHNEVLGLSTISHPKSRRTR